MRLLATLKTVPVFVWHTGFVLVSLTILVIQANNHSEQVHREWDAERAKPSIHNNAAKCQRHCHNAGLRVVSWDGAYPSRHTQHGCRCGE